jgi:SAM-dependent methyltransferase
MSASRSYELALPHPRDAGRAVVWDGAAFEVDGKAMRVLQYDVSASGWTDELTRLHEETSGSDHFMDVASRAHALSEVMRCTAGAPALVLEVGCSSGFLLREMLARMPQHRFLGADYTRGTLENLGKELPHVPLVQFDLTRCPLPTASIDVVVLLNVLEHIADHEAALAHLYRIIRPGGSIVLEVPASASLFDIYDRALMHHRRYDMRPLVNLIERAGFVVERRSHLGFFVFPVFSLAKRLNQIRYRNHGDVDAKHVVSHMIATSRRSNTLMNTVMDLERLLRRYVYLPWGIRCLVTGGKPTSVQ